MKPNTVTVDVRDDIRNGSEPFSKIMLAVANLRSNDQLLLIAPFEPVPLFRVMEKHGFQHRTHRSSSGNWEVLFTRRPGELLSEAGPVAAANPPVNGSVPGESVELDARGLEPPQPLAKILESLATLPAGAALHARTDRRPVHLYPHLEERGFTGETEEQSDGSHLTRIRRR